MNAADIILAASQDGVNFVLTDAGFKVRGDKNCIQAWLPILKEYKPQLIAELHRQQCRAKVLGMLADGRRYAVFVPDPSTDPVVAYVGIRGLATFELNVPHHSYNGMVLLELIEKHAKETSIIGD